jgi:hypothetical protein
VTIQDVREEPRPGSAAAAAAGSPNSASEQLLSPLSTLLLSPLSSVDLSAEPLSPSTTAAFLAARARYLALQQMDSSANGALPELSQQPARQAAAEDTADPALPEGALEECEEGEGPPAEISAFLDTLLAAPQNSIFAPQPEAEQGGAFVGDPGKDPPPWKPLRPPGPWPADRAGPGMRPASSPWSAARTATSDSTEEALPSAPAPSRGVRPATLDVSAVEAAGAGEAERTLSAQLLSVKSQEVGAPEE